MKPITTVILAATSIEIVGVMRFTAGSRAPLDKPTVTELTKRNCPLLTEHDSLFLCFHELKCQNEDKITLRQ
jgi:hypothetical protein